MINMVCHETLTLPYTPNKIKFSEIKDNTQIQKSSQTAAKVDQATLGRKETPPL